MPLKDWAVKSRCSVCCLSEALLAEMDENDADGWPVSQRGVSRWLSEEHDETITRGQIAHHYASGHHTK